MHSLLDVCYDPFNCVTGKEYSDSNSHGLSAVFKQQYLFQHPSLTTEIDDVTETSKQLVLDAEAEEVEKEEEKKDDDDFKMLPGFCTYKQAITAGIKVPKNTKSHCTVAVCSNSNENDGANGAKFFRRVPLFWIGHLQVLPRLNKVLYDQLIAKKTSILERQAQLHINLLTSTSGTEYLKDKDSLRWLALKTIIRHGTIIRNTNGIFSGEKLAKAQEIFNSLTGGTRDTTMDLQWPTQGMPQAETFITYLSQKFPSIIAKVNQKIHPRIFYVKAIDYYVDFVITFTLLAVQVKKVLRECIHFIECKEPDTMHRGPEPEERDRDRERDAPLPPDSVLDATRLSLNLSEFILTILICRRMGLDITNMKTIYARMRTSYCLVRDLESRKSRALLANRIGKIKKRKFDADCFTSMDGLVFIPGEYLPNNDNEGGFGNRNRVLLLNTKITEDLLERAYRKLGILAKDLSSYIKDSSFEKRKSTGKSKKQKKRKRDSSQ
jgi:hypothetical protein